MAVLIFTADKKRLQNFFRKAPGLFAYHLGDLDDFYFEHCQWPIICDRQGRIEEAALLYSGGRLPALLAFGLTDKYGELLGQLAELLPPRFYCHHQGEYRDFLAEEYRRTPLGIHLKMKLEAFMPVTAPGDREAIKRLDGSHQEELQSLYDRAYPGHYFNQHMLATGKYFGYESDGRLAAVTGVHVDSARYRVAVLGNIVTAPEHRGRGLATRLTSHLTAELDSEGKMVCLNVKADNAAAIRCYAKLGFASVYEYEEAYFELKEP
jgi:ribosomal protein S18 acetylase RimI-like enzyme